MPPADTKTTQHRLIDALLKDAGQPDLATVVGADRAAGISWRRISNHIRDLTGEDVSNQALIEWFTATAIELP